MFFRCPWKLSQGHLFSFTRCEWAKISDFPRRNEWMMALMPSRYERLHDKPQTNERLSKFHETFRQWHIATIASRLSPRHDLILYPIKMKKTSFIIRKSCKRMRTAWIIKVITRYNIDLSRNFVTCNCLSRGVSRHQSSQCVIFCLNFSHWTLNLTQLPSSWQNQWSAVNQSTK